MMATGIGILIPALGNKEYPSHCLQNALNVSEDNLEEKDTEVRQISKYLFLLVTKLRKFFEMKAN